MSQQTDSNKWIRSGDVIDASTKIYGFRVDNVHTETYRMLNGMTRNAAGEQEVEIVGAEEESDQEKEAMQNDEGKDGEKKKQARKIKFNDNQGEKTLEKKANIDVVAFDTLNDIDPLFK